MASVKREETSRGPRWRVRYRQPDGTETSRRFDRAGAARDFAAKIEHDRRAGTYIDPAGPRTLFADVAARWAATADHADTSVLTRDSNLKNHVLPALGHYRIGDITPLELKAALRRFEAVPLAPATVRKLWAWVSAIFTAAVDAGLLTRNPAIRLGPPSPKSSPLVPLEGEQAEAIIAALPGHYQAAARLAADVGLRNGEVFGLTVSRVGLVLAHRRALAVERQLIFPDGAAPYVREPKDEKTRIVPVDASTIDSLAEHMARYPRSTVVDQKGQPVGLVFASGRGGPVGRSTIDRAFARAVARAGLPKGIRFHDLRHYYASVLIDAGLSEREIGLRLGHSSAVVTARYGHLFEQADDRTRNAVGAAIRARQNASSSRP